MILGLGVDMLEVSRVERAVARNGAAFLEEFLTPREMRRCGKRRDALGACAAAYAAKEAVLKAFGREKKDRFSWQEMEIAEAKDGSLRVRLTGAAARLARRMGIRRIHVAVSVGAKRAAGAAVLQGPGASGGRKPSVEGKERK